MITACPTCGSEAPPREEWVGRLRLRCVECRGLSLPPLILLDPADDEDADDEPTDEEPTP